MKEVHFQEKYPLTVVEVLKTPEIKSAFNVVFCFGHALPNPMVLAVRPRSIGIADLGDKFVVSFMDAPMKPANDAMQAWALGLRNRQN